jgi:hypothetical protein
VADEEDVATPGGQGERVEGAAAELVCDLGLYLKRLAGEPSGVRGAHLWAGQAGVDLGAHRGERLSGRPCLALALGRQPAGGVAFAFAVIFNCVSVSKEKEQFSDAFCR